MRKHKRKQKRKPKRYLRRAAKACAILVFVLCILFAVFAVIVLSSMHLFVSVLSPTFDVSQMRNEANADYWHVHVGLPLVVETIAVPLNADEPVYTENEFTEWVTVTVSGSVEREGEFYLDGLFRYDDKQQYAKTLFINGAWAFERQSVEGQFPDYSDDHFYRFTHWVGAESWNKLGFQFLDADATDLEGVFTVEVSNDPYHGRPEAGGR